MLTKFEVGNVTIHRIVEQEGPFFEALQFFPKLTKELLDENRSWLQPVSVLVEKLSRDSREKLHRLEEWTLLLDDAVNRGAANFDWGGQDGLRLAYAMTGACQIGMLQPARQVGLAGSCFRHDQSARRPGA